MEKRLLTIEVDEKTYKSIKKKKKTFYVTTKEILDKDTKNNSKINVVTEDKKEPIAATIREIYTKDELDKLNKRIKKKGSFDFIKESDNLVVLEFKTKKKLVKNIVFLLLAIALLLIAYVFIESTMTKMNNASLNKKLDKVSSEITYVIIEINPKMILELKDGKVANTGCLNEDCLTIFKDVNLKDKSIKEATKTLYEEAKKKNVDVSNGVSVQSTNASVEKEVKELEYVNYKKIEKQEEKEHINNVIDNKEIKEEKNKNKVSNDKLAIYKEDKDYGKLYECKIVDSEPVCYITKSFAKKLTTKNETVSEFMNTLNEMHNLENVLDKFGFDYERGGVEGMSDLVVNRIVANGTSYPLYNGMVYETNVISATPEENNSNKSTYSEYYRSGITIYNIEWEEEFPGRIHIEIVPLEKIELISRTYDKKDIVTIKDENGYLVVTNDK